MTYKVKLSNAEEYVLLDPEVYEWLSNDPYFSTLGILKHLRMHSSGCAVFQKSWRKADGTTKIETYYLHKLIAEKYLAEDRKDKKNLVSARNGDKLDCRIENLLYRSRATASRQRRTTSHTGYTGVYKEHNRYRAVISIEGKATHLAMFDTPEEAAAAYNRVSKNLFGDEGKINKVKK